MQCSSCLKTNEKECLILKEMLVHSWLPEEMMFMLCHVHIQVHTSVSLLRTFEPGGQFQWNQMGARYRGKLKLFFEDRGLLKRELWLHLQYRRKGTKIHFSLNSEEFTQWRNFKKKCSWRLIFIDKQNSPTFMWNPSSFIQVCKQCSVCNTWVLQIQSALAHASFLSFNIECCKKFSDFFKVG